MAQNSKLDQSLIEFVTQQQKLNDFSNHISRYKTQLATLSVPDKLRYIHNNTRMSGILNNDVHTQEAFSRLLDYAGRLNGGTTEFFTATALHTDTDSYAPVISPTNCST